METKETTDEFKNEEVKDFTENDEVKNYIVLRDSIYMNVTREFLETGLYLDGSIIEVDKTGSKVIADNRHRLCLDSDFFRHSDTVGGLKYDDKSVKVLEQYFIEHGKLPSYLGFKNVNGIVRIFAKKNIASGTYLGNFEGLPRPPITNYRWGVPIKGFNQEYSHILDADNITFSNWTRYLLLPQLQTLESRKEANCLLNSNNYSAMVFSKTDIKEGEELYI